MINTNSLKIKSAISLSIFLFVNFAFAFKYSSRYSNYAMIIALAVVALQFIIWKKRNVFNRLQPFLPIADTILIIVFIAISIYVFERVPVESLNVDRWSVITSFWDNYFNNQYVYFAESNVGNMPGPMPFYFITALPFYFTGELGYYSLAGIIVFYVLLKYTALKQSYTTTAILITITSTSYLWEVVCRSNIFLNSAMIVFSMVYFSKNEKFESYTHLTLSGIIFGLLMSTRNVFAIPYIILFVYYLKAGQISFVKAVYTGLVALCLFIITFLPFVINHTADFMLMNPFIIQGSFLMPFKFTLIFIALALVFPLLCKNKYDVYFYSGLLLFLVILFYFGYHIFTSNFTEAFVNSHADISYFLLCMPFALYYMIKADVIQQQSKLRTSTLKQYELL